MHLPTLLPLRKGSYPTCGLPCIRAGETPHEALAVALGNHSDTILSFSDTLNETRRSEDNRHIGSAEGSCRYMVHWWVA